MKRSRKVAFCGIISALALVLMLTAYFPYLLFAIPAMAGALLMLIVEEVNKKWALGAYAAVALLSLLICEKEASLLFVFFFGVYPIIKSSIEKCRSRVLEYILKYLFFNATILIAYVFIIFVFGISMEVIEGLGAYTYLVLLALGNIVFIIYDIALSRLITGYIEKLQPRIRRILK